MLNNCLAACNQKRAKKYPKNRCVRWACNWHKREFDLEKIRKRRGARSWGVGLAWSIATAAPGGVWTMSSVVREAGLELPKLSFWAWTWTVNLDLALDLELLPLQPARVVSRRDKTTGKHAAQLLLRNRGKAEMRRRAAKCRDEGQSLIKMTIGVALQATETESKAWEKPGSRKQERRGRNVQDPPGLRFRIYSQTAAAAKLSNGAGAHTATHKLCNPAWYGVTSLACPVFLPADVGESVSERSEGSEGARAAEPGDDRSRPCHAMPSHPILVGWLPCKLP